MTDIVERLRDCWLGEPVQSLVKEAAAEIERLRAALKNIRELNFTSDGWAHSDLIEQEIVFALALPQEKSDGE